MLALTPPSLFVIHYDDAAAAVAGACVLPSLLQHSDSRVKENKSTRELAALMSNASITELAGVSARGKGQGASKGPRERGIV